MVRRRTREKSDNLLPQTLRSSTQCSPSEELHEFRFALLDWFNSQGRRFLWRRSDADTYIKIVSEVLLQRTRAETVARFVPSFLARYPSWKSIARSGARSLSTVLKPLGLWQRRTSSLMALAKDIDNRHGVWPKNRMELEAMPAVGQYIASAILLFEHGCREPLLDGSMARVLRRYFDLSLAAVDIRHDRTLQSAARSVLSRGEPTILNWAILDAGAAFCKTLPKCSNCPLKLGCAYAKSSMTKAAKNSTTKA